MAIVQTQTEQQSGKFIAFEGDVDAISTQLRLLPPSQKILILPSLVENLPPTTHNDDEPFNAREFIRNVHTNFTQQTKIVRAFLRQSTSAHPRLVFMNGGSITARTTCILRICENLTGGDVKKAQTLFNEIVRSGIKGLMKPEEAALEEPEAKDQTRLDNEDKLEIEEIGKDLTITAMKAVDSMDRESAVPQTKCEELEANSIVLEQNLGDRSRGSQGGSTGVLAEALER